MFDWDKYKNQIIHANCMDIMKDIPDKYFELAIVDPPYGIGMDGGNIAGVQYVKKIWDYIPSRKYFKKLFKISQNQVIWGGNYFTDFLTPSRCWIVWDKNNGTSTFADGELAWTSFKTSLRIKQIHWCGSAALHETKLNKIHPTQKPVQLYRWLLTHYAKQGDKIIDTHSGSGSLAIACHLEKFDFLAIEKDYDYWKASVERYEQEISQGKLF